MVKKKTKRKTSKPLGFVKVGKSSFKLVFGTRSKPRLGSKLFRSKKSLLQAAKKRR